MKTYYVFDTIGSLYFEIYFCLKKFTLLHINVLNIWKIYLQKINSFDIFNGQEILKIQEIDYLESDKNLLKSISNEASYAGKRLTTNSDVPGRIGHPKFFNFWRDTLQAGNFQLNVIKDGYLLPFETFPPTSMERNNNSALKEPQFARAELTRLERLGCIYRVDEQPYIVCPLSVVFSKKLRLVVDASRAVNPFLKYRRIKLEDLSYVEKVIREGDFMSTMDLDSGRDIYFPFLLPPQIAKILCFPNI